MPELPEVETIVRGLRPALVGKTITAAHVFLKKVAVAPPPLDFVREVTGERIDSVERRGKYAVFGLGSGRSLVTSLRMTGRLVVLAAREKAYPYTHVELRLSSRRRLAFADMRQFGRMRLVELGQSWDAGLGIEPLSGDFTPDRFIGMLSGRTTPVKVFLLDQRRIAGVGNIYACEALWQAGIRPATPAKRLSKAAATRLHHALVDVLQRAIGMRGSSVDDYVDAQGLKGGFQNVLSVYGRSGAGCSKCGGSIVRTVIAQRGTWWCRTCQK